MRLARIGAGVNVLWGLLRLGAAYEEFILMASVEAGESGMAN